jgi:hypothetical protein
MKKIQRLVIRNAPFLFWQSNYEETDLGQRCARVWVVG